METDDPLYKRQLRRLFCLVVFSIILPILLYLISNGTVL